MRFLLTSTRFFTLLLALLAALALPASAVADGKDVIRDCAQDGDLDEDYSDEELADAYNNLPSDIDEYSDCRDVIRQAQAGGKGGPGDSGGDTAPGGVSSGGGGGNLTGDDIDGAGGTASDQEELKNRELGARAGNRPDRDTALEPVSNGAAAGDDSGLPTAALVAIVLLVLSGILGLLYMLRDRLPPGLTSRVPGFGPGPSR